MNTTTLEQLSTLYRLLEAEQATVEQGVVSRREYRSTLVVMYGAVISHLFKDYERLTSAHTGDATLSLQADLAAALGWTGAKAKSSLAAMLVEVRRLRSYESVDEVKP